ncbi:putative Rho guanyl nucleotide exchange factor [Aspergillus vadensis CBS 113365]|uniref:Dynamin-binding protein n=1 Tax=Aspergillus vadensis (strain CBS 113365 / IMI 142717 / IBT 24658) TaxID=1448311 RepID=A0A319C9J7_ASPVC|nr:Rho guanyl nucleotide exchange factor [Aspergillus vadensis CBS 113365]PYH72018.1 Rho guanyl nucleotide exchange factor [Aspergillus vadensis CBS 113365]
MSESDVEHVSGLFDGSPRQFQRLSPQSTTDYFYDALSNGSREDHLAALSSTPVPLSGKAYPTQPGLTNLQPFPTPTSIPPADHPNSYDRSSPDPDDYYRPHLPTVAANDEQEDLDLSGGHPMLEVGSDAAADNHPPKPFQRVSSVPIHLLESTNSSLGQYRSASDSSYQGVGHEPAWGSSVRASAARSGQTSFKDLINKFNNNVDQVLPVPSTSSVRSRVTSRAASPTSPTQYSSQSRALPRQRETPNLSSRPQSGHWQPKSVFDTESPSDILAASLRTASIDDSHSSNFAPADPISRRPTLGEPLRIDTSPQISGYGTSSTIRRRGSDGIIPSPNPAFLDPFDPSAGVTPLTPTAWYLGRTPFLESVSTGSNTNTHRRTKSDIPGNWSVEVGANPPDSHMAVPAPLQANSQACPDNSPHTPKSRIPISSHRLNSPSVSDESPPPSRAGTHSGNRTAVQVHLPPKGTSRLPKPSPKSPRDMPKNDQLPGYAASPRAKREMAHGRSRQQLPERNALLEAYIAAPPPKKSPPLRSSRPRQPIAHTQSSRSKVVETVSNFQRQINRDREYRNSRARERRLPELGHVDFATRRQKIQQAFNRTVEENERKEEKAAELRRQANAQEDKLELARASTPEPPQPTESEVQPSPHAEDSATVIEEAAEAPTEQVDQVPETKDSRPLPELHVDTDIPTTLENVDGASDAHLMTMDSPTLGHAAIIERDLTYEPKSHAPPASDVTSESNETHVTAFDTEPQVELSRQDIHTSHRTLLSQIMNIRESSPSSSSCDEQECSFSENDERDALPTRLRNAFAFDDQADSSDNPESCDIYMRHGPMNGETSNRWSMSSWSSSLRNQHSVDEQCDNSGDDFSQLQQCTEDSEVATQSCSASSSTPSITDHQILRSASPKKGSANDGRQEAMSHPNGFAFSNASSLARLGGWDSKRVGQLYLQELANGRSHGLPLPAIRASPEPSHTYSDKKADQGSDSLTDDPVVVSRIRDTPALERPGHTASLVLRDDWEHASPSIMDWMQVAAAEDESALQAQNGDTGPVHDSATTPRLVTPNHQSSCSEEADEGLGLAIKVHQPQELDSHEKQLPSVPEPPEEDIPTLNVAPQQRMQPPSNVNVTEQRLSTIISGIFAPLDPVQSTGSSEDSSLRRLDPIPSPQTFDSSSTSLVPSTSEPSRLKAQSPSPEQRRLKKRRHVIKELVDTEYTFGRDMKVVDDIYKGTSSSCLDLSSEDVKILFANSDQVVQFSMAFQDALKEAAKSVYVMPKSQRWSSKRSARHHASKTDSENSSTAGISDLDKDKMTYIGQAFMNQMSYMEKVYADYLKNHDAANKKLQTLQRNPKVAIWLKECRDWASDLTTAWDLDSLLVKPVQRILKYPLLLAELLDSTPDDHPDHPALVTALEEVTNISVRINEMKKRADLVGQVVGRKRKESDVRAGLSKAFGRRTEKLRQQVGLSDMVEDKEYDTLAQKFGDNFFQLQLVMRDAEMYTREVQTSMDGFNEFVEAIQGFVNVSPSNYAELEGRWRELKTTVAEIMTVALPEHIAVVRKSVIDPMVTLLKLHDGPQRVMRKRDKRLMDYARFKGAKERGDKPDKKTTEQGEQFVALNETLKDELPKLYALTAKLMEACLKNFVHIQTTWFRQLQHKLGSLFESFPEDIQKIVEDWSCNFNFSESQVLSLGICNGSLLADTVNLVNFNTPSTGATISSPRRPSTVNSVSTRVGSTMEDSPKVSQEFGNGSHSFHSPSFDTQSQVSTGRHRADSTFSGRTGHETAEIPRSQMLQQITSASTASVPASTSTTEAFPSLPRLSLDSPFLVDVIGPSSDGNDGAKAEELPMSPDGRYSGFFSSAMPMSDNPQDNAPTHNEPPHEPAVLFLAASIYEFNIDRARREAGYPYLTYVVGEIFDVIAEKGELWLAKNQDDPTHQVGWIWNKHFAKLSA